MPPLSKQQLRQQKLRSDIVYQAGASMGSVYSKQKLRRIMSMPQVRQALEGLLPGRSYPLPDETGGHVVLVPFESNLPVEWVGDEASFVVKPSITECVQMTRDDVVIEQFDSPAFLPDGVVGSGAVDSLEVAFSDDNMITRMLHAAHKVQENESTHTYTRNCSTVTTTTGSSFSLLHGLHAQDHSTPPQIITRTVGTSKYAAIPFAENDLVSFAWEASTTAAGNVLPYILTWNGSAVVNTTITAVADNAQSAYVPAPANTLELLEVGFKPTASSTLSIDSFSFAVRRSTGAHHNVHANYPVGGDTLVIVDRIRSIGGKARMVSLNAHLKYTGGFTEGGDVAMASVPEGADLFNNVTFNSMFQRVGSWTGNLTDGATGMWMPTAVESRLFSSSEEVLGDGGIIGYCRRDSSAQTARLIVKGVIEVQCNLKVHNPIPAEYNPPAWKAILFIASRIPMCFDNDNHVGRILESVGSAIADFAPAVGLAANFIPGIGAIAGPAISTFGTLAGTAIGNIGTRVRGKKSPKKFGNQITQRAQAAATFARNARGRNRIAPRPPPRGSRR